MSNGQQVNTSNLTIKQAIDVGIDRLTSLSDSPKVDIEVLLCEALKCTRTRLLTHHDELLTEQQQETFLQYLQERETGKPVSYIIGHQDFWSLSLRVNESTLIPRPETEILVEEVLKLNSAQNCQCLDLGTGTGAIALAIAAEKPAWAVTGCDCIRDAVALAEANRIANGIENASFAISDWFSALTGRRFDIIVSNPPYVESDSDYLQQGDLRFEPLSALIAEDDGLADIRQIVQRAPAFLNSKGWLLLEHGFAQACAVQQCLIENGFTQVKTIKDYAGLDRVTLGQRTD